MVAIGWKAPTAAYANYMTTGLDSLAINTTVVGIEIDNSINRDTFLDLILSLASLDLSAQTNPVLEIYLIKSDDAGSPTYEDGEATANDALIPSADHKIALITLRLGTAAEVKNSIKTRIPIPQGKWKIMPRNKTGVNFGTGNILKYRTYKIESV